MYLTAVAKNESFFATARVKTLYMMGFCEILIMIISDVINNMKTVGSAAVENTLNHNVYLTL